MNIFEASTDQIEKKNEVPAIASFVYRIVFKA